MRIVLIFVFLLAVSCRSSHRVVESAQRERTEMTDSMQVKRFAWAEAAKTGRFVVEIDSPRVSLVDSVGNPVMLEARTIKIAGHVVGSAVETDSVTFYRVVDAGISTNGALRYDERTESAAHEVSALVVLIAILLLVLYLRSR